MKIEETKTETVTRVVHVDTVCDVCGLPTDRREAIDAHPPEGEISPDINYNCVRIEHDYQGAWSWNGDGEAVEFKPDICPPCFLAVVVPALRAAGCKVPYSKHNF